MLLLNHVLWQALKSACTSARGGPTKLRLCPWDTATPTTSSFDFSLLAQFFDLSIDIVVGSVVTNCETGRKHPSALHAAFAPTRPWKSSQTAIIVITITNLLAHALSKMPQQHPGFRGVHQCVIAATFQHRYTTMHR